MNTIEELLAELRTGRMVVVMDDEDRENEGDLLMVASRVRAEDVNFMARYGRGLICLTLSRERCRALRLPLMVSAGNDHHGTSFTVSIEAAEGVTTGISAHDRARTIQAAVAPGAGPDDLRQPGHVFPLMAQPGGVLTRAGHTEAGCDLARLAGFEPAAVIVEILNEDGSMARRPELLEFARRHGLCIGTIADLIRYRLQTERTVGRIAEREIETGFGPFRMCWYEDPVHQAVHVALVRGRVDADPPPLVRVHLQDTLRDLVELQADPAGWPLRAALERVAAEDNGVVVILRQHESPRQVMELVASLDRAPDARGEAAGQTVLRTYGVGAQILQDLGVTRMRVLSAPKHFRGISAFGLEITEYVE